MADCLAEDKHLWDAQSAPPPSYTSANNSLQSTPKLYECCCRGGFNGLVV